MRWSNLRGLLCLAAAMTITGIASAADSFYVASTAGFGGVDISATPTGMSNAGIDRLLEVNSAQDSVLSSYRNEETTAPARQPAAASVMAPLAEDEAPNAVYLITGVGAAFAMGLGLCCAGLMSGRKRTINTFTAGYVQLTK